LAIPFSSSGGLEPSRAGAQLPAASTAPAAAPVSPARTGQRLEFLSIVIPAYNEETRLPLTLVKVHDYCRARFAGYEVLVVDDGSTDSTAALASSQPQERVLHLPHNSGKGAAVRAGMLAARGELLLFTDADLSTPIEEMDGFLRHLEQAADVVIASRDLPDSRIERHQNPVRETMGKGFNLMVRILAGLPYTDTQCGFKCYRRSAALEIFRRSTINGFAFDVETLIIARRLGYSIAEVPVRWVDCPRSKVQILRHPAQMLADLLRIRWREARGGYV
jgi:dolichyl-phosphate beta-glucosyltransferase